VNIDGVQLDLGKITIIKYAKTWHKQKVVFNYKAMKNYLKKIYSQILDSSFMPCL
jgi:hypothetical protein